MTLVNTDFISQRAQSYIEKKDFTQAVSDFKKAVTLATSPEVKKSIKKWLKETEKALWAAEKQSRARA